MIIRNFLLIISCISTLLLMMSCQPALESPIDANTQDNSTNLEAHQTNEDVFTESFIRVQSTIKAPLAHAPWQLPRPKNQYGMGVVLNNGYILTSASMVANASYIEISDSDDLIKEPAIVVACDYDSNLALLKSQLEGDSKLKKIGIELSSPINKNDIAEIWQLESQGETITTDAVFQKALIIKTLGEAGSTLCYQFKASLQRSSNSFCLPVMNDKKLLGIMVSYQADEQRCIAVSLESIQRFIRTFEEQGTYGLPLLGFNFQDTLNPIYRNWLQLPKQEQGIIVTKVIPNSPVAEAGIKKYDIITNIGGHDIDSKGYYHHPHYSKLFWTALIEEAFPQQATLKMQGYRQGELIKFDIALNQNLISKQTIIRQYFDEDPLYYIYGGFIFQELSLPYLRNVYGSNWLQNIPHQYFDIINNELTDEANPAERIVIISRSIPAPTTQGYQGIDGSIVTHINGQKINNIQDIKAQLSTVPDKGNQGLLSSSLGLHILQLDRNHQIDHIAIDTQAALEVNTMLQQRGLPLSNF